MTTSAPPTSISAPQGPAVSPGAGAIPLGAATILRADGPIAPAEQPGGERARRIQRMFADIAHAYDFNNHFLSLNIDRAWRNRAVRMALEDREEETFSVLDCCTGTGDLALALARGLHGQAQVVGADFTAPMLLRGRAKQRRPDEVHWVNGDSMRLPFADDTFDLATVAFGIRNVADLHQGLSEMVRVVRPGGRVLVLEFTPLRNRFVRWAFDLYFNKVLAWVSGLIARRVDAYRYLAESVEAFPDCDALKAALERAGLGGVRYRRLTFGIAAIHVGEKPAL